MSILERLAAARSFEMLPRHPSDMGFARRWLPPKSQAEGHEDGFIAEKTFVVTTKHFRMRQDCYEAESGTGRIIFLYHLDGKRTLQLSTGETFTLTTPCFVAYCQPEGISKTSCWKAGEGELSVGLGFDSEAPPVLVQDTALDIAFLRKMLADTSPNFRWLRMPLDPAVSSVARSMVFTDVDNRVLQTYVAAKASELLCLTLDNMVRHPAASTHQIDLDGKLGQIKSALENDLQSDFSLEKLSEEYDVPKRKLNRLFEDAFGVTIRDYSMMIRMERSVYLLAKTRKPLKQIAFEIGYGHASNFCLAFKRYYGQTPKSIRERSGLRILH